MELIDVLDNIDFETLDTATGVIGDLQYTFNNKGRIAIPASMHGDWRDYVVRNCNVLNKNRVSAGLASIDMLMSFTVNGVVYAMEIIISDAVSDVSEVAPVVLQLDDVAIEIDAVVDNGKQLQQRARRSKGSK